MSPDTQMKTAALELPATRSPLQLSRVEAAALVAILAYYVASTAAVGLFAPGPHTAALNSMALRLLEGRFDVDPATIGYEAYVRDGLSYAYFGIFPALLRIPLIPFFDISGLSLSRLYALLALTLGALGQAAAVRIALSLARPGQFREFIAPRLTLAVLLSGPPILLARMGSIYDEVIAWAWALSMLFIALALHGFTSLRGFSTTTLTSMAVAAGLSLLTRATTALGLYTALGLILLWLLAEKKKLHLTRSLFGLAIDRRLLLPAGILIIFILIQAGVNYGRWGDPFLMADMSDQVHQIAPGRVPHFETYGLFNPIRLGYGLMYYFFPVWVIRDGDAYVLQDGIQSVVDGLELPPSSFLLTDPLLVTLAIFGGLGIRRGRIATLPRPGAFALLAGLLVTPTLLLSAWYMAFRYRAEFYPALFLLSCVGAVHLSSAATALRDTGLRRLKMAIVILFLFQIILSHFANVLYLMSSHGAGYNVLRDGLLAFYAEQILRVFVTH
jgi:hypothetical protein